MLSKSVVMILLALAKNSDSNGYSGSPGSDYFPSGSGYNQPFNQPDQYGYSDSYKQDYNTIAYSSAPGAQGFAPMAPNEYGNPHNPSDFAAPGQDYGYNEGYNQGFDGYHNYPAAGRFPGRNPGHYPPYPPVPARPGESLYLAKLFPIKIGLFALGKILLKILFFKKMLKFIGILALLLVLPVISSNLPNGFEKIPHYPGGSFDEGFFRSLQNSKTDKERMKDLSDLVKVSIKAFNGREKCPQDGDELWCRMKNTLNSIDKLYPFARIAKLLNSGEKISQTKKETT